MTVTSEGDHPRVTRFSSLHKPDEPILLPGTITVCAACGRSYPYERTNRACDGCGRDNVTFFYTLAERDARS